MALPAIEVANVSKRFLIHHNRAITLKERFIQRFSPGRGRQATCEVFWALRGITLNVMPGETVGIIGPNGSGKSTLLRVIARIYRPTAGQIRVSGQVMPLIELGLGFHPELTGEENIYLNASLFGLSRSQIRSIYPKVVEFSELQRFIDTPIKNYSSGMSARLGFSIAVHLDPDILLLDEILSVGDASFVSKCLEKIREFQQQGKTIVLVSHSAKSVKQMCQRAFLLQGGRLIAQGTVVEVLARYDQSLAELTAATVNPLESKT